MPDPFDDPFDLDDDAPAAPPASAGEPVPPPAPRAAAAAPGYLAGLNAEQQAAVETVDGPVLVLAGAGTGKTRVLTTRIAHILATRRAWPNRILAVTFTNKAAREMKERIGQLIGGVVEGMPWLGTFHSIAAQILRRHAELVGLTSAFTILDTDDQVRIIKQIFAAEKIDDKRWPARQFAFLLDRWKNKGWHPDQVPEDDAAQFAKGRGADLYRLYQERLKFLNAVDFGDLLLECLRLLRENPDLLAAYQERFSYILVDEYQDTNVAQYLWLRLLAQRPDGVPNICCVGDDDQSIYGWRGAEVDNILRFEQDFADATVIRLERNYRSTGHILGAASGLITANRARLGKTLWTDDQGGDKITIRGVFDDTEEARSVTDTIEALHRDGETLDQCAILVRASSQMRAFEDRFVMIGLPYRVVGGPRFYERQEIRDANAYFRIVANPADSLAFERIFNTPSRKLGDKVAQAFTALSREQDIPYLEAARRLIETGGLKGQQAKAMGALVRLIDQWTAQKGKMPHWELAGQILDESGYMEMWANDKSPQAPGRIENLKELVRSMGDFDTLEGYLEHIALVMDLEQSDIGEKVTLMTLHGAKGLEFDTVFLPGWEEGLFPSQRSMDENGEKGLEEERRLAYVGITRARKRAFISYATMRTVYGRVQPCIASRFIGELPEIHVDADRPAAGFAEGHAHFSHPSDFESTYATPGWRRAQAARARSGSERKPISAPQVIDHQIDLIATSDPTAERFALGDRVVHQKFGVGTIAAMEGAKLTVAFDTAGNKRVIASFVDHAETEGGS